VTSGALELDLIMSPLLVLGGVFAGYVNAVAGGGSALTLPLLMLFGIDAAVANGTNRVAVGIQAVTASASFHRQGVRPWSELRGSILWVLMGALVGVIFAVRIPAESLDIAFSLIFLALAILMAGGKTWLEPSQRDRPKGRFRAPVGYLLVGLYGGVLQAGVGIPLLLALIHFGGQDVVRGNALKAVIIATYTALILVVFHHAGQVAWVHGILVGLGGILGSVWGARSVIHRGAALVRFVVIVALLLAGIRGLWRVYG